MLQLEDVTLAQGAQSVLEGLHLSIEPGQRLGIMGPSGAGKTSILQTVAGLLPPQTGRLNNGFSRIGYVFQEPRLLPWLSARANVAQPLIARGVAPQQARHEADTWLQRLFLPADKHGAYPGALSGGMAQRVSLARAFALKPDLLLLDEPFSALDPQLRRELISLCDRLLKDLNCALLYVCHHPEELQPLTREYLLVEGRHRHRQIELPGLQSHPYLYEVYQ